MHPENATGRGASPGLQDRTPNNSTTKVATATAPRKIDPKIDPEQLVEIERDLQHRVARHTGELLRHDPCSADRDAALVALVRAEVGLQSIRRQLREARP